MSFLGSIGSALGGLGKVALPVLGGAVGSIVPGVGTALGGALGGAAAGLLGGGGAGGALSGAALGMAGGNLTSAAKSGGVGGLLGSIGNYATSNPGLLLGGAATLLGAQQQAKAGGYQQQALDLAHQQYNDAAPFRSSALAALSSAGTPPNLSWMTSGANPYSAGFQKAGAPGAMPTVGRALTPPTTAQGAAQLGRARTPLALGTGTVA